MDVIVKIETIWIKEDATGNPCDVCEEQIFSKSNTLYLIVNDKKLICAEVCEACYQYVSE